MIRVEGSAFKDEAGRTLMLRGANLGGSSKVPRFPNGATHLREGFFDHRRVSFVGRPFPLAEADEHFARLASWGLTFIRLLVTWEAIEHGGPGVYDEEYLDYLRELATLAGSHGISIVVDPHQDMWSRFTGGDGAPGWTLEALGFDIESLDETGAALTHQVHGDPLPRMIWPTNSGKLAASTMYTLFFAGADFAPRTRVDGEATQEFLQRHYLAAMMRLAGRLRGVRTVVGYGVMNEPMPGYIGWKDLHLPGGLITLGDSPTAYQGMLLGAGIPQSIAVWHMGFARMVRTGERLVNPLRRSAWKTGYDCPWRANGVWGISAAGHPELLRPDHFTRVQGRDVDFNRDYLVPFMNRFAAALHETDPQAAVFVEGAPNLPPPAFEAASGTHAVFAPHWYDDLLVGKKRYYSFMGLDSRIRAVVLGPRAIRRCFADQLADLRRAGNRCGAGAPTVLAEFGIPFDLNGARAYRTGSFRVQERALDRSFRAVEDNLLSCAIWNYTPDNSNARGDQWNGEDFSIYSPDQGRGKAGPDAGSRALRAFARPYPRATAGEPLSLRFDLSTRLFAFEFRHDPAVFSPTEIFVPRRHYPRGYQVTLSDGECDVLPDRQLLVYRHSESRQTHIIRIRPAR